MNNDSIEITASEINKYTYCPYQFYYERLYGAKYIMAVRKDFLEEKGYTDSTMSNFVRGQKFHDEYNEKRKYPLLKLLVIVLLIVIGISLYDRYSTNIFNFIDSYFSFFKIF